MKRKICPDCSDAEVFHFVNKWTVALDAFAYNLSSPLKRFDDIIFSRVNNISDSFFPLLFNFLKIVGIGEINSEPDKLNNVRAVTMWQSAKERGIEVREFRIFKRPINVFEARFGGEVIIFEGLPRPKGFSASSYWMDNKEAAKIALSEYGIPVARGGSFFFYKNAEKCFKALSKPVIVKPSFGSRSRHTTIHIYDEGKFKEAFRVAKKLSPWVIVEEELKGSVYRVSVIGGKVAGALRRDPPMVYGNGVNTIKELIDIENKNPKRSDIFHQIPVDSFVIRELAYRKLSLSDISQPGQKIILHSKVGRSQGGTNTDVTDQIHPENIKLFEKIAETLNDSLIGVDFIISDIGLSWKEQELCGMIECNSIPFLDLHHFPFEGKSIDVMGALWEVVFPAAKPIPH